MSAPVRDLSWIAAAVLFVVLGVCTIDQHRGEVTCITGVRR